MTLLRVLLLSFLCILPMGGQAAGIALRELAVLVDAAGTETIASVSTTEAGQRFVPLAGALNAGYTNKVHWLRFTVQAPQAGEWWLEVQPPYLDDLRLFEPVAEGFAERRTGDRLPFDSREEDYRGFIFKLKLADTAPHTYYLRLQSTSSSLAALKLWHPDEFHSAKDREYALLGFYYGFSVLALVFSLILFYRLGDSLFAWFSLLLLAHIFLRLGSTGLATQLWLRNEWQIADAGVGVGTLLYVAAYAPLFRRMLRIERDRRFIYWMLRLQVILPCLLLPSVLLGFYTDAARFVSGYAMFSALVVSYECGHQWRKGLGESPYLFLASVFFIIGGARLSLFTLGILPSENLSELYFDHATTLLATVAMLMALVTRLSQTLKEQRQTRVRAELAELAATKDRDAYAEQGRFISMLSHEIKTPLAVIDSAAQSLERLNLAEDPEVTKRNQRIRRSVNRIDTIIVQFLNNDQLELQCLKIRTAPVLVTKLIQKVFDGCLEGSERLVLHCQPTTLALVADAVLLRVALLNLIENALKYTSPASPITVSAAPATQGQIAGVTITVADEGLGIPDELKGVLFSRYTRGNNVENIPGSGLGLSLVKRIIEMHGGTIELLPQPGGAVFRIWLPIESRVLK